ncbi:MAG: SMP-30/gluconolactonase/LRE family protein, partial [Nostoc sp.]
PVKPVFGPDGNLYVSGLNSNNVLRYDGKTGAFIDTFIPAGRGGLNGAGFLAFTEDSTIIPEPRMTLAVLAFGATLGASKLLSRKQKSKILLG